jgi:transcriptional regulator with XRE-family HTH domain/DNA-directed RNA polymerase subunit RPC12/RpoP
MDQLRIGKFIAECRKEKKLTQMQLAEKLGITDKAVSKWERGIAMPDSSIMLDVCGILGISVNELLSGEKINMEEQSKKTEELLLEFTRKEERLRKKSLVNAWVLGTILCLFLAGICTLAILASAEYKIASIIIIFASTLIFMVGAVIICKMEFEAGPYICQDCQHEFIPKFSEVLLPVGTPKNYKVRAKCPKCGKKTWAKKVLPK